MPPKVKQTAEEIQAEIDADPLKIVYNPVKKQKNKGINKEINLTTEKPAIGSWFGGGNDDDTLWWS